MKKSVRNADLIPLNGKSVCPHVLFALKQSPFEMLHDVFFSISHPLMPFLAVVVNPGYRKGVMTQQTNEVAKPSNRMLPRRCVKGALIG